MTEHGPLLASGRSADIYEAGPGRVLRRMRSGRARPGEVASMRHAASHGYPVPEVFEAAGADVVMARVDGDDLLSVLGRRPWRAGSIGRTVADLHTALAAIPVDGSPIPVRFEPAEALVHGDLHPGNVIMTKTGPVVIDWEGAGLGPSDADVATTWLLLEIAEPDHVALLVRPVVSLVRRRLLRAFLAGVGRPRRTTIRTVCEFRLTDPNMRPVERVRIEAFLAANG